MHILQYMGCERRTVSSCIVVTRPRFDSMIPAGICSCPLVSSGCFSCRCCRCWCLIVDTPLYLSTFRTQDYTRFLASATETPAERTTTGLAVHQAGLPHFDILVTDDVDVLVFCTLGAYFGLPEPVGTDSVALTILQNRTTSQFVTTAEQLKGFVSEGEMKQQLQAMKVIRAKCTVSLMVDLGSIVLFDVILTSVRRRLYM